MKPEVIEAGNTKHGLQTRSVRFLFGGGLEAAILLYNSTSILVIRVNSCDSWLNVL